MDRKIREYLSQIGKIGGKKSRRVLDSSTAKQMVKVREAKRAFRKYRTSCFWSFDSNLKIKISDVTWVAEQLMKNGDRSAWEIAAKLCR